MTRTDFDKIQKEIAMVVDDMRERFPDCHYTVKVLLWDDGTSSIECRHAHMGKKEMIISISTYYNNHLFYGEYTTELKIDNNGNEYNIKKKMI